MSRGKICFKGYHVINSNLLRVFEAFSPNDGEWSHKIFDSSHDLSKLPTFSSQHLISRIAEGEIAIRILNGGRGVLGPNFDIVMTWCREERDYSETSMGYPTLVFRITSARLGECLFTYQESELLDVENPSYSQLLQRFKLEKHQSLPASACRELVEIGRMLAKDLDLNITIPNITKPTLRR